MVLAMTHEEMVTDLVRRDVQSYKHLPRLVYHIQTKWRDEPRPRAGLIRAREFTMNDSYSLDADWDGLDQQYRLHYQAYFNIYHRCGLPIIAVNSDIGMMGGTLAHEYMYLNPIGEDSLLLCDACDYRANRQVARFRKTPRRPGRAKTLQRVLRRTANPSRIWRTFWECPSPAPPKRFSSWLPSLKIPEGRINLRGRKQFIFAVMRGDMEVNETKLANAMKARSAPGNRGRDQGHGS